MAHELKTGIFLLLLSLNSKAQNALYIPPALSGTTFNLSVQSGSRSFYPGTNTPTFGVNGSWMAPTIVVNKGDSVTLNVTNNLTVKTTMHWHGLHVSPQNDGGPHQSINPNTTWSPSFTVRNNASTYWYHPHGAGQTDPQVSKGLAGLFIVHDPAELALNIPHTYGVDDIPLILQSKAFDELQQIAIATGMDTALFVNGTLHPYLNVPAQVIRFRVLNGSSLRSYNLGLSNGQAFYQIGTDGGLLDTPVLHNRLILSPGERVELLYNGSGHEGETLYLKSYASDLPQGIYGADTVGTADNPIHDYEDNFMNGADFDLLQLHITAPGTAPVTSIPVSLVPLTPFDPAAATKHRTIVMDTLRLLPADAPNLAEGPFGLNGKTFDMEYVNDTVLLNTTEIWTLKNKTQVAHPFHIHDIQFNVVRESGVAIPPAQRGWKDVVLVMPGDSVQFLTRFETFSDPMVPYMYHCHLLHHEDDGMMGSFLVLDPATSGITEARSVKDDAIIYPNPARNHFTLKTGTAYGHKVILTLTDMKGVQVMKTQIPAGVYQADISRYARGIYALSISGSNKTTVLKLIIE